MYNIVHTYICILQCLLYHRVIHKTTGRRYARNNCFMALEIYNTTRFIPLHCFERDTYILPCWGRTVTTVPVTGVVQAG